MKFPKLSKKQLISLVILLLLLISLPLTVFLAQQRQELRKMAREELSITQEITIHPNNVIKTTGRGLYGLTEWELTTTGPFIQEIYKTLKPGVIELSGNFVVVNQEPKWHDKYTRCLEYTKDRYACRGTNTWCPLYTENNVLNLTARDECVGRPIKTFQVLDLIKFTPNQSYNFEVEIKRKTLQVVNQDSLPSNVFLTLYYEDGKTKDVNLLNLQPGSDESFVKYTKTYNHNPEPNKTLKAVSLYFSISLNNGGSFKIRNPKLFSPSQSSLNLVKDPNFETISFWKKDRISADIPKTNFQFDKDYQVLKTLGIKPVVALSTWSLNFDDLEKKINKLLESINYLGQNHPQLEYFDFDNEFFGPPGNQLTPEGWARRIKPAIDRVLSYFPNAKISLCSNVSKKVKFNYQEILDTLGENYVKKLYALSHKYYPLSPLSASETTPEALLRYSYRDCNSGNEDGDEACRSTSIRFIDDLHGWFSDFIGRSAKPGLKIISIQHGSLGMSKEGMPEGNPSDTLADALWHAELLGRFARHPKVILSTKFRGVARIPSGLISPPQKEFAPEQYEFRPAFYTYYLLANHWGKEILKVDNPNGEEHYSIFASKEKNKIYALVVNRLGKSINLTLNFGSVPSPSGINVYRLTGSNGAKSRNGEVSLNGVQISGESLGAFQNSLASIPNLPPNFSPPSFVDHKVTLNYPALSLTVIELELGGTTPSISLSLGWNQITWPDVSNYTAKIALEDIDNDCGAGTAVALAKKEKDWWENYVKNYGGKNFALNTGKDYHVNVSRECSWNP